MGYCCEDISKIENYEKAIADKTNTWECHHRLETHTSDGERRLVDISVEELKALNMYYNHPASELIFLTTSEHDSLHKRGKKHSDETKRKMSESRKGNQNAKGKHKPHSEETKNKISDALKGRQLSEEPKKKLSEVKKGKRMSEEVKRRIAEAHKGKHWKLVDGKRVYY